MKVKVQVVIEYEDETSETITEEISVLTRQAGTQSTLGLTLAEGKAVLSALQEQLLTRQVEAELRPFQHCNTCHKPRRRNGRQRITYRTLFGNFKLGCKS